MRKEEAVSRERQRLARKVAEQQAELERLLEERQAAKAGARQRRVGEEFRACEEAWCPELVVVPAGEYTMGSPGSEEARDAAEGPRHKVTDREDVCGGEVRGNVCGVGCVRGWGRVWGLPSF